MTTLPDSPEPDRNHEASGEDEQLWAAVADPSRRRMLDLLLIRGQATPTGLAAELPVTRQAVAKHLAVLVRAGLVEGHRHGREMRYSINAPRLAAAAQAMSLAASRWDRRLQMIKQLAEAAHRENQRQQPPGRAEPPRKGQS